MSETKIQREPTFERAPVSSSQFMQKNAMNGNFARVLETGMSQNSNGQGSGQPQTQSPNPNASHVPAHAVLSVAVANGMQLGANRRVSRGTKISSDVSGIADVPTSIYEQAAAANVSQGDAFAGVADLAKAGNPNAQMMMAQRQMTEFGHSFNIQYLLLQQSMEKENRAFTTLSNVLKAKSEGSKSVLKNIA